MTKCIVFDFDGVIANTDESRYILLNDILKKYELELNEQDRKDLIGLSTKSFLQTRFKNLSDKTITEIIEERHSKYLNNLKKYCIPYDGMFDAIEKLSKKYSLVIATTNNRENVIMQLKFLKIHQHFDFILGREVMENELLLKSYSKVSSIINYSVNECVVIEDSTVGISAAKEVGYNCIQFNPNNDKKNIKANEMAVSYNDLYTKITNTKN